MAKKLWVQNIEHLPSIYYQEEQPDGYIDKDGSIVDWDRFGKLTGLDFKVIKYKIYLIRVATGYANLSLAEKIITNKYFVSGVEYNNAQVTTAEQDIFFLDFVKPNANSARESRDLAVSGYLIRKIYTGVITQSTVDNLINDARSIRTEYLRDGLQGIGYGDTRDGLINFVKNDSAYSPFAIVGVNTTTKIFSVAGDKTSEFTADKVIRIHASTGNDGAYTVVSSSFDATNTLIVVAETVPSSTADGSIYTKGLLWYSGIISTQQDELFQIYWDGIY